MAPGRRPGVTAGTVLASIAVAAVALLSVAPNPASAAGTPDEVLVSSDGVRYARGIDALFDSDRVLVPGGSRSASVWIRNDGAVPAAMRMTLREATVSSDELGEVLALEVVDPMSGSTTSSPLAAWGDCAVLASSPSLRPGQTVRVDLELVMADVDGLAAQGEAAGLEMVVALRDGGAGSFPASACQDDGVIISTGKAGTDPGGLARTGSDLPGAGVLAAAVLVGFGAFFALGARRMRRR